MNAAVVALQSVIEWTEDAPPAGSDINARALWYSQRLLLIRNCARAGIQAATQQPRREEQRALDL